MSTISFQHAITETRKGGTVNQTMIVQVDYYPEEDTFNVLSVNIYENGRFLADISKLLHKAEGNPLNTIVESINWGELYADEIAGAEKESIVPEPEY